MAVALRTEAGAGSNSALVLLRSGFATRVYLGASIDAADRVIEWLEVWVQTVAGLAGSAATWREYVSNAQLDRQWTATVTRFAESTPGLHRQTGWEASHPEPLFLDPESAAPWQPVDAGSGKPFQLCTDDALLESAGLPPYTTSLHRYWFAQDDTPERGVTWIAATPDAPTHAAVREVENVLPADRPLLAVNAEGGLMHARRFAPIDLEAYVDLLSGLPWRGITTGAEVVKVGQPYDVLGAWDRLLQEPGNFWLGGRGRTGTLLETFHLRVQLILQLVDAVARVVADTRLPMLNLTADSFRIELATPTPGLPLLWSASVVVATPGAAVALPIQASGLVHYLPLEAPGTTIYRPDYLGWPVRGRARVRMRRVTADTTGLVSVEGTLVTSERIALTPLDLVWIKLPLPGTALDLFARVDTTEALAIGESRFRTEPQPYEPHVLRTLRAAEGNAYDGTAFETIPMLSTPCDLYALGVLAVRALFVDGNNSLGIALDEVLSLARQIGADDSNADPASRVRALVSSDPRWRASLGPHRLSRERIAPDALAAAIPEDLWWEAVSLVARLFPGNGSTGYCRDFADVPAGALERVFAQPLADLQKLLVRTRGVLFSDWPANREVAGVLARVRLSALGG